MAMRSDCMDGEMIAGKPLLSTRALVAAKPSPL